MASRSAARHPRPFGTDPLRSAWRSDGEAGGAAVDAPAWPGGRSRYPAVQVCGGEQLVLGRLDQGQVGGGDQDHQGGQEQRAAPLRSEAGRASARPGSRMEDDQRGKQGKRLDHHTHALTCDFGARGRIRTDDLPITRRMLGVGLDGSRRIEPAHVGWPVGLDGSRRIQKDRLDDQTDDQRPSDRNRMPRRATPVMGHRTGPQASGRLASC
jgi:hypothetical protein